MAKITNQILWVLHSVLVLQCLCGEYNSTPLTQKVVSGLLSLLWFSSALSYKHTSFHGFFLNFGPKTKAQHFTEEMENQPSAFMLLILEFAFIISVFENHISFILFFKWKYSCVWCYVHYRGSGSSISTSSSIVCRSCLDLVLLWLWHWPQLQLWFDPWPRNFNMLQVWS